MAGWASIGRASYYATKAFFLVVFAGIVGAQVGMLPGLGLAAVAGDTAWVHHGRCAGWTFFVATALIGIPTGHIRFANKRPLFSPLPAATSEPPSATEPVKAEGRLKSLLVAPSLGALMGLFFGGMIGGFIIAFYFFVALSPLGPGGWWPVLPLTFRAAGDGFSASSPWWLIPWSIVVGAFVLTGAVLGLVCTTTLGNRRYEVFPRGTRGRS